MTTEADREYIKDMLQKSAERDHVQQGTGNTAVDIVVLLTGAASLLTRATKRVAERTVGIVGDLLPGPIPLRTRSNGNGSGLNKAQ